MTTSQHIRDYRLIVRAKNNRILQRMDDQGFRSIKAFCEAYSLNYPLTVQLINISRPALKRNADWRDTAYALASALKCDVEELFTQRQARAEMKPAVERRINESQLLALSDVKQLGYDPELDEVIDRSDMIRTLLECLTPREERLIRKRYGLGCAEHTLDDLTEEFNVTCGRLTQIEAKAMRKMRTRVQRMMSPRAAVTPEEQKHLDPFLGEALAAALQASAAKPKERKPKEKPETAAQKRKREREWTNPLQTEAERVVLEDYLALLRAAGAVWPNVNYSVAIESGWFKHAVHHQPSGTTKVLVAPLNADPEQVLIAINLWASAQDSEALERDLS